MVYGGILMMNVYIDDKTIYIYILVIIINIDYMDYDLSYFIMIILVILMIISLLEAFLTLKPHPFLLGPGPIWSALALFFQPFGRRISS